MLPKSEYRESQEVLLRIHDKLDECTRADTGTVTFSLGAVTYNSPKHSIDEIIQTTDRIMYKVKSSGKNSIIHEIIK
jgi:GGDEF domain-containing protein